MNTRPAANVECAGRRSGARRRAASRADRRAFRRRMLSPRAAAQRRLRRVHPRVLRGRLCGRCSTRSGAGLRAAGDRRSGVLQRAGRRSSRTKRATARSRATGASPTLLGPGLQHAADRPLLRRTSSHIHRVHHPHCNERARDPDMQSEFFSMYPRVGAAKTRPRAADQPPPGGADLDPGLAAGLHAEDRQPALPRAQPARDARSTRLLLLLHFALWFVPPVAAARLRSRAAQLRADDAAHRPLSRLDLPVNHIGTRVIEPDEPISFFDAGDHRHAQPRRSRLHDFLFGGLNNHIEHHLFPVDADRTAARARRITREFCRWHGIALPRDVVARRRRAKSRATSRRCRAFVPS